MTNEERYMEEFNAKPKKACSLCGFKVTAKLTEDGAVYIDGDHPLDCPLGQYEFLNHKE